jgi:hypothetical protein
VIGVWEWKGMKKIMKMKMVSRGDKDSDGVIEGLRAFTEDDNGEHAGEPFQVQVVSTLALSWFGVLRFWPPLKELNGIVVYKHFEDIQSILEKELKSVNDVIDLLNSRR